MLDLLSLHDAERIAQDSAPVARPGLTRVFTGMLRTPAQTLSEAIAHPIQSYAMIFAAAGGIYWALNFAIAQAPGQSMPLPMLLSAVALLGICGGIAYLFALTILLDWSCDIMGGSATRKQIRVMLAYVGTPGLVALALFGVPRILIFGQSLFMPARPWMSANPVLVWGLWFGDAMCFAWSLLLTVKALKMMNQFSTARAMAVMALPLGPAALIGLAFVLIAGVGLFTAPVW